MHGKIIQIAGVGANLHALTSTGKILRLGYGRESEFKTKWVDITPDIPMTDRERELLNSLEEKE